MLSFVKTSSSAVQKSKLYVIEFAIAVGLSLSPVANARTAKNTLLAKQFFPKKIHVEPSFHLLKYSQFIELSPDQQTSYLQAFQEELVAMDREVKGNENTASLLL